MSISIETEREIFRHISRGNTEQACELMRTHLDSLNTEHANHTWLEYAIQYDNYELASTLLDMGADVNATVNNNTCALWMAVVNSTAQMTKLLLCNGADPNICRVLISALNRQSETLEVVRLLVEHGVNINEVFELEGTGHYFTALDWTTAPEIEEYLISVGAKTADELRGNAKEKKFKTQREAEREVIAFFTSLFGKVGRKSQGRIVPTGVPVSIHVIEPTREHNCTTLFTTGLSNQRMKVSQGLEPFAFAELFLQLPPGWKYSSKSAEWAWPLNWLRKIAEHPHATNTSLGGPVTIIANEDPPQPLASNTAMTSWLLLAEKHFKRSDGENVELFRMTPLHTKEREFEINHGAAALLRAFDEQNVPFILDPERPSVV